MPADMTVRSPCNASEASQSASDGGLVHAYGSSGSVGAEAVHEDEAGGLSSAPFGRDAGSREGGQELGGGHGLGGLRVMPTGSARLEPSAGSRSEVLTAEKVVESAGQRRQFPALGPIAAMGVGRRRGNDSNGVAAECVARFRGRDAHLSLSSFLAIANRSPWSDHI